jgi:hypothetical protein
MVIFVAVNDNIFSSIRIERIPKVMNVIISELDVGALSYY